MNRTKEELLLECIKQFEHIENVLEYNRLSTTRSLIDEINQALTMPAVIKAVCSCGRREICVLSGICDMCWNEKFPDEQIVL